MITSLSDGEGVVVTSGALALKVIANSPEGAQAVVDADVPASMPELLTARSEMPAAVVGDLATHAFGLQVISNSDLCAQLLSLLRSKEKSLACWPHTTSRWGRPEKTPFEWCGPIFTGPGSLYVSNTFFALPLVDNLARKLKYTASTSTRSIPVQLGSGPGFAKVVFGSEICAEVACARADWLVSGVGVDVGGITRPRPAFRLASHFVGLASHSAGLAPAKILEWLACDVFPLFPSLMGQSLIAARMTPTNSFNSTQKYGLVALSVLLLEFCVSEDREVEQRGILRYYFGIHPYTNGLWLYEVENHEGGVPARRG
ncbi:hypothetical protein DFH09DRAFT_1088840 [Mycena vulgaris]|nr:hypothetical protein DFH09DRAFT_1088840 [Mycena vulgaris]